MSSIEHGYGEVVRAVSSPRTECLKEIAALNKGILCDLFTELTRERLVRKQCDIDAMLRQANYDWNQTLIMLLFRVIGSLLWLPPITLKSSIMSVWFQS